MSIKKIIFGVVGFLIAGTSTTLTVLLVKNKNEKKDLESDQKIQINNLFKKSINGLLADKNLFEAISSGRTKNGEKTKIVQLKKIVTILDMIQIEAAINNNIFEPFVSRGNTIAIKNQDLLNDNVVKIRFSIKSEFQATHTFPNDFTNIISFKVSDLKKEIDTSLLSKESFKVVKNNDGSGTFSIISKGFPPEIKVLYAIKRAGQTLGDYSDLGGIAPHDLNRGDVVSIKFAIKDSFNKFPTTFANTPFLISVPKRVISAAELSSLSQNLFEVSYSSGTQGEEKLKKLVVTKPIISLPRKVEIEASINNGPFEKFELERRDHLVTKNQRLLDNTSIRIRFSIKSQFQATHTFPNDFVNIISFKVSDLKKEIDTSLLSKESFKVVKNTDGSRTFSIVSKGFQPEIKVLYAIKRASQAFGDYSDLGGIAPHDLNRGDVVSIKFAIKDSFNKFPTTFANTPFLISVPKRVISASDLSSLSQNLFIASYSSGTLSEEKLKKLVIAKPIISLPRKVEIEASINNGPFEKFVSEMRGLASKSQNLLDNTKIRIRFSIKSEFQATHTFPNDFTNIISFKVSDLKKEIDTSLLSKESFKVVKNTDGSRTFSIVSKGFQPEIKVLYAIKRASQAFGDYSDLGGIAPHDLNRGDVVSIKFAIKDSFNKFPTTFANTPFLISVPKRVISASDLSSLSQNLFIASYSSGTLSEEKLKKLVIAKPIISLPRKVEIEASINNGPFEKFVSEMRGLASKSQNLLDNTKIRIRFSIKSQFQATHTFPNDFVNIISFKVSDLKKEIDTSLLSKESFKVVENTDDPGTFSIVSNSGVSFPVEVKVLYAIKRVGQAFGDYSDLGGIAPRDLIRGDVVSIKFAIKDSLNKFPSAFANTPFELEA